MYIILIFSLFSQVAYASLPELFASSAHTMGVGNQSNFNRDDASNNSLIPAISAFSKSSTFSFGITSISTNFIIMDNIVVENDINASKIKSNDFDPNLDLQNIVSLHAGIKLFKNSNSKLLISFFTPIDKLLEANTGDPYLPQYFVYQSRLQRSLFYINFANQLDESLAYSFGVVTGLQSSGVTKIVSRENGSPNEPSLGQMSFNATPSLAPSFSIFKSWNKHHQTYLSYISEMKSNFTNEAKGMTPVGNSALRYDWTFESLLYYDPSILRLGHLVKFKHLDLMMSFEYLGWSSYETPKIRMTNNGGILTGSDDYEAFSAKDILVPKFGFLYHLSESKVGMGLSYRPRAFENDLNLAGNSIDTDSTILSMSFQKEIELLNNKFEMAIAGQYHSLKQSNINKTKNNENNQAGSKIGSPGYDVGGSIFVVSFGLNWVL